MDKSLEQSGSIDTQMLSRAQGCLLGQLSGDALGSLVEFKTPEQIRQRYPDNVRDMENGGTWGTIAGQPTDDSEMALMLARTLVKVGTYNVDAVLESYIEWLKSDPFDYGSTVYSGLMGKPKLTSQANGALMRISPLGIFAANCELNQVAEWARQDAALTHPNPVCLQANALFAMAIAFSVKSGPSPTELYDKILTWAKEMNVDDPLMAEITGAADSPPVDYVRLRGWLSIALRNALWQLLHAKNLEDAVINTVMHGGDTDTNAAICGALLGSVYGIESIPKRWLDCILKCRPSKDDPRVYNPRPECFWPVDALSLAEQLLRRGCDW